MGFFGLAIGGALLAIVVGFIARAGLQEGPAPSDQEILSQGVKIFKLSDGRTLEYYDSDPQIQKSKYVLLALHGEFGTGLCYKYYYNNGAGDANRTCRYADLVYPRLFGGVRIIAPTWPGFGGSTTNPEETLLGYAQEIKLLLQTLKIDKFMLVGGSWYSSIDSHTLTLVPRGGAFALAVMQVMPERVVSLGLLAPALPALPDFAGWTSHIRDWAPRFLLHTILSTRVIGPALIRLLFRPVLFADYSQRKIERIMGNDPVGTFFEQPPAVCALPVDCDHYLNWLRCCVRSITA